MQQTVEGLWWKRDPGVSGFVALSNVMDADTQATVQLVGPGNSAQAGRTIALPAHSTRMLQLEDLADNPSPLAKHVGGIRVQYTGRPGSVQITGGLESDSEGYSANIPFWGHDMSSASPGQMTYASAGIMVGEPDPMMMPGFPKDTTFIPYLTLRNTSEKPLDVTLQLNYMMMGMEGSAPVTRNLPAQHLGPFEARQVDMHAALNSAGLKSFNGTINLSASFSGKAGDLVLATGSVDQTGSYVFEVEPESVETFRSKNANYWGVANGNDTMFTLWNPTSSAQDILVTFYYGDGSGRYDLPVHIGPQASTMIDMAMLIAEKKPDANSNIIPPSVQEGSAEFASAKGRNEKITLVIAAGIYNVGTATCHGGCITCCGDSGFGFSPNPISCPIGQSVQCTSAGVDCHGIPVLPFSWSSSNTSVMTVNGSGNVTGVSAGSATITANFGSVTVYTGQQCGGSCPSAPVAPSASGTVTPPTVTIGSFSQNPILQGSTATVTITVNPSASISLAITGSGTGAAKFDGQAGSTTKTISGTTTVTIYGSAASTNSGDLTLTASYNGTPLTYVAFSVTSGACTLGGETDTGSGPKACPSTVTLQSNYTISQYCSTCSYTCSSVHTDGTWTPAPGSCSAVAAQTGGSLTGTEVTSATGTFAATDCNWHYAYFVTRVVNAQNVVTNDTGASLGLRCTSSPGGNPCP